MFVWLLRLFVVAWVALGCSELHWSCCCGTTIVVWAGWTSQKVAVHGFDRDMCRLSVVCTPRRHQDPAEQGEHHADTAQHEHLHWAEAGGRLQEHIPRKHRADISGTTHRCKVKSQVIYRCKVILMGFPHRGRPGSSSGRPSRRTWCVQVGLCGTSRTLRTSPLIWRRWWFNQVE